MKIGERDPGTDEGPATATVVEPSVRTIVLGLSRVTLPVLRNVR